MNFIIELIELVRSFFEVLFAVPIFGILLVLSTVGPAVIKAVKHR